MRPGNASNESEQPKSEAENRIIGSLESKNPHLSLRGLRLATLPDLLFKAVHLQSLDLSDNHISEIPQDISRLKELRKLDLRLNEIKSLPPEMTELCELLVLDASDNDLSSFAIHPPSLVELYLLRNSLNVLDSDIATLNHLEVLHLSGNDLVALPEALGKLLHLRVLDVSTNRLRTLPETLQHLVGLRYLFVHDNPDLNLPAEIAGDYPEKFSIAPYSPDDLSRDYAHPGAILNYHQATLAGCRPLNEGKLILLGRGEVGKTCIVNRLVHDAFKATKMTQGIAITQWKIATIGGKVRLHIWDFGGQEIQHATHRFFLSERSLYLVVLNGRSGGEDDDAEYWLRYIKTFGGGSPTIVILNKFKVQPFTLNRRGLKEKYPFIFSFVETDCEPSDGNGIPTLKLEIQRALDSMAHVRAHFPTRWLSIKEALTEADSPFISFNRYRDICASFGETNADSQNQLAAHLHALGIALNFREHLKLREETVLNPRWITDGVYQILTSKELAHSKGILRLGELDSIFRGRADLYPPRMHSFLIELMGRFELSFPFHDDTEAQRFLIPELLEKEEPPVRALFPPAECLNFRYSYSLLPEGLLPRFITRTHSMSEQQERWRTGVVLHWENARALVLADKHERQVTIRVHGETEPARRLMAVIRQNFDSIHNSIGDFRPAEFVALEWYAEIWVDQRELETMERSNISVFPKVAGKEVVAVNVPMTLDRCDTPGARSRTDVKLHKARPLKLFISYSHDDNRWRQKLSANLSILEREKLIEVWHDIQIHPGSKWNEEIERKLQDADIYLFLVSTALLASSFVQEIELPIAKARCEQGRAVIVPVVISASTWKSYFGEFQALPSEGKPLKGWQDKDKGCHTIEEGLRTTIEFLSERLKFQS